MHEKATRSVAADFLRNLIKAVPYKVHTVLTDNGTHFTDPSGESWTVADIKAMIERKEPFWAHAFAGDSSWRRTCTNGRDLAYQDLSHLPSADR